VQQNVHEGGHKSTAAAGTLPSLAEESRVRSLGNGRVCVASDQPLQGLTAQTHVILWYTRRTVYASICSGCNARGAQGSGELLAAYIKGFF